MLRAFYLGYPYFDSPRSAIFNIGTLTLCLCHSSCSEATQVYREEEDIPDPQAEPEL